MKWNKDEISEKDQIIKVPVCNKNEIYKDEYLTCFKCFF